MSWAYTESESVRWCSRWRSLFPKYFLAEPFRLGLMPKLRMCSVPWIKGEKVLMILLALGAIPPLSVTKVCATTPHRWMDALSS